MQAGTGETERAFPKGSDRPPSWFSSGSGTKADAKQQSAGFCARVEWLSAAGEPAMRARGGRWQLTGF